MMDVDQPVSSTTDTNEKEESATLDADPPSQETADATSAGRVTLESDDIPALLISDSEEEDDPPPPLPPPSPPATVPSEEVPTGGDDISGIAPFEATVADVQDDDKSVTEGGADSEANGNETVQETAAQPDVVDKAEEDPLVDNIDLTGASSADDSAVSEEPSSERTTTVTAARSPVVSPKAPTKPSSEMTAQELLESLLGAQEEAFASHRASELEAEQERKEATVETKSSEEVDIKDTTPEPEKITTDKNPDSSSMLSQDGKAVTEENGSKMDTVVIDDECLLEEMSNVPAEMQQEMDIDDHHTGSSNASSPNHNSDGAEQANDETDAGMGKSDDENSEEPPRKRARSSVVVEDSKTETTEPPFHGIEHDTVQNDTRSEELAHNSDNLNHEKVQLASGVNLSEAEPESAVDALDQPKTTTPNDSCSSGSANGGPLEKQCLVVGEPQTVKPVEPSICPDVLVIDDDDDEEEYSAAAAAAATEASGKSNLSPEIQNKQDTPEGSKLQTILTSDNTSEDANINSKVRLSPAPSEKMEPEPIAMEFLRKFNKPLSQMTRTDLEQLVLQKVTEAIVHRSESAELRRIVKRQSARLQHYERTIADMTNHYEGLKLVADRAVADMKKRAKSFVAPVKITRAVGLQVSRPATDTVSAHKLAHFSKLSSGKQKCEPALATVTTTTNGAAENGWPNSSNHMTPLAAAAAATPFSGVNSQTTNRSQYSNNVSAMNATRCITSNPASNGMVRTTSSNVVVHNNGVTAGNVTITHGNTVRLSANLTNDVSVSCTPSSANLASVPLKTGSATASPTGAVVGGVDSPVRKKFHKITPKRPPLSPYQHAQQEKQARQQQELLVQQIHEQSQQAQQRKAQISVRQDVLPAVESSSMVRTTAQTDASANRQRSMPPIQGRLLNATNSQAPATQNYQVAPYGAIRPVAASVLTYSPTTTSQLSEDQTPNSQPTAGVTVAAASPPVNGSLIDLTDEDDATSSSVYVKRAKISHSGAGPSSSSPAPPTPSSSVPTIATNQLVRIQHRINAVDGGVDTVISAVPTNSSSSGVASLHNSSTKARPQQPINRPNNAPALQPIRHPIYNSNMQRIPATQDMAKKRVVIKPLLAPLPNPGPQPSDPSWKLPPPDPVICVNNVENGIVISWAMPSLTKHHASIETYQIYAYQEPSTQSASEDWRHVGDVKALLLPMAVTLTQFHEGQRYYFAVRAIDTHKRVGKFCEPRSWNDNTVAN